jgi:hemolysin III
MFKRIARRIPTASLKQYTFREEIANSVIHGLGILFGIVSLTILLTLASIYGSTLHFVCYLVYGLSMILLYTSSTLYHALPFLGAKKFFKVCDHVSIYLLIAGTYTPFLLVNIGGNLGWTLFAVVWTCALVGIAFKFFFVGQYTFVSTLVYLAMGWMIVFAYKPLSEALTTQGLTWIIAGGLAYSGGTVFYLLKKIHYHHAAWHFCVLLGSVFHFISILYSSKF